MTHDHGEYGPTLEPAAIADAPLIVEPYEDTSASLEGYRRSLPCLYATHGSERGWEHLALIVLIGAYVLGAVAVFAIYMEGR